MLKTFKVIGLTGWLIGVGAVVQSNVYAQSIDYTQYERVLNEYVNEDGLVDYEGLSDNRIMLDNFIETYIEEVDISGLNDDHQKAFWINAYNALTLRLIIDNYPLRFGGIRTINWGRPWNIKMKAAGQTLSLGDIEHEILRKWNPEDPRIHFAINCASIGCPKLPATHFDPERLDEQLDYESRRFITDPKKVRLDRSKGILHYSAIFKWFQEDFLVEQPDLKNYILQYMNPDDAQFIQSNKVELKVLKYDWGLNKQ